jgi:hypothetical protein
MRIFSGVSAAAEPRVVERHVQVLALDRRLAAADPDHDALPGDRDRPADHYLLQARPAAGRPGLMPSGRQFGEDAVLGAGDPVIDVAGHTLEPPTRRGGRGRLTTSRAGRPASAA